MGAERNRAKKGLTIGTLARLAGVGVETVRFYERRGLLAPPPRRPSGYRAYPPEAVDRLRFIRRAKALGFTLAEIGDLLALRVTPDRSCDDVRAHALEKIADIDARIRELTAMRGALTRLAEACAARSADDPCPILKALEDSETDERPATGGSPARR